jgi:hypothetical protein
VSNFRPTSSQGITAKNKNINIFIAVRTLNLTQYRKFSNQAKRLLKFWFSFDDNANYKYKRFVKLFAVYDHSKSLECEPKSSRTEASNIQNNRRTSFVFFLINVV